jgi:hypothetical protein
MGKVGDVLGAVKNSVPGMSKIRKPDHPDDGEHDPANNKYVGEAGGSGAKMNVRIFTPHRVSICFGCDAKSRSVDTCTLDRQCKSQTLGALQRAAS